MENLILSQLPLDQLKTEISQSIKQEIEKQFLLLKVTKPETEFLTRKETAKLLGVSLPTILGWTKTGKITGYRIASRIRYKREEIETSLLKIRTLP